MKIRNICSNYIENSTFCISIIFKELGSYRVGAKYMSGANYSFRALAN